MATWDLTSARLRELLTYCPETGVFTWNVARQGRGGRAGSVAGCLDIKLGYWRLSVDHARVYGHRAAWLYMTGEMPELHIDHIDGNRANNAWANLREVSMSGNCHNRKRANSNNSSGILGTHWDKARNRWGAKISVNCKSTCLGYFHTAEEAGEAYLEAKRRLHPTCTI